MQGLCSNTGASSSRVHATRPKTTEAQAHRQLTPPESPALDRYEILLANEADRHVLEGDTDRTQVPADLPLLVLSPKESALLHECRSFVKDLVEKKCRDGGAEEHGKEE